MSTQIQLRRGTSLQWSSVNPILAEGEMGVELDTGKYKIGTGTLNWNAIPYVNDTNDIRFTGYNNDSVEHKKGQPVHVSLSPTVTGFTNLELANGVYEQTSFIVALAAENIPASSSGLYTSFGVFKDVLISDVMLSTDNPDNWVAGTLLWLAGENGKLTTQRLLGPNHSAKAGNVTNRHGDYVDIIISIDVGREISEAHDARIENPVVGQTLVLDNLGGNYVWRNHTLSASEIGAVAKSTQYIRVAKDGGDFTNINDALNSITDASSTKPYIISVYPGFYLENPFSMKPNVSIIGLGSYYNIIIATTDNNQHFITGAAFSEIRGIGIQGPTASGCAAVYHYCPPSDTANQRYPFKLIDIAIRKGWYGVLCYGDSSTRSRVHCINVVNYFVGSDPVNTLFSSQGKANIILLNCAQMSGSRTILETQTNTAFHVQSIGSFDAEMSMDACSCYSSVNGLICIGTPTAPAVVRMTSCNFSSGDRAIDASYSSIVGAAVNIADLVSTPTSGIQVNITNNSTMKFSGSANKSKIHVDGTSHLVASFNDATVGEEGQVVFGELWLGANRQTAIPLRDYGISTYSTGWVSGGEVTQGASAINVTSGYGYVNDGLGVYKVTWPSSSIPVLPDQLQKYLYVNNQGQFQIGTEPEYVNDIVLGAFDTDINNDIVCINDDRVTISQSIGRITEYLEEVIGPISNFGGVLSVNATNKLGLDITSGEFFRTFIPKPYGAVTEIPFRTVSRSTSANVNYGSLTTSADVNYYDAGADNLQTIPATAWVKHMLYMVVDGSGQQYFFLVHGQELFSSKGLAEAGNLPLAPPNLLAYGLRLYGVVVSGGATEIGSLVDYKPRLGQFAGGTTSVTNHNDLAGIQGNGFYHLSQSERDKLLTIAPSAEVNVQSDWNVTDPNSDAYIKNKSTMIALSIALS